MTSRTDTAMAWREALSAMRPTGEPCPGISATDWPPMRERALDFLDQLGAWPVELGWTAEDLFGVHPQVGTRRGDYTGALVLRAGQAIDFLDANRLQRGHLNFYRTKPGRRVGIPICAFKA